MYTEEELLEAVDILIEEYGFDEDEAIDLVVESYEIELDVISESVDILVEDYGFDEDEAIDMVISEAIGQNAMDLVNQWNDSDTKEREQFVNKNRGQIAGGALAAAGLTAYKIKKSMDHRRAKKDLKERHMRQMDHIARKGKRLKEEVDITDVVGVTPYKGDHKQYGSYAKSAVKSALLVGGLGFAGQQVKNKLRQRKLDKISKKYSAAEDRAIAERRSKRRFRK